MIGNYRFILCTLHFKIKLPKNCSNFTGLRTKQTSTRNLDARSRSFSCPSCSFSTGFALFFCAILYTQSSHCRAHIDVIVQTARLHPSPMNILLIPRQFMRLCGSTAFQSRIIQLRLTSTPSKCIHINNYIGRHY